MKLSIIWKLSERENDNQVTLDYLKAELAKYEDAIQILIYPESKEQLYHASFQIKNGTVTTRSLIGASEVEVYEDAQKAVDGDFVTYLYSGDRWSENALSLLHDILQENADDTGLF